MPTFRHHSPSPALVKFGARLARAGPWRHGHLTWGEADANEHLAVQVVEGCIAGGRSVVDSENARMLLPALLNYYMQEPASLPTWPEAQQTMHWETRAWLLDHLDQTRGHAETSEDIVVAFIHRVHTEGQSSANVALRTLSGLVDAMGLLDPADVQALVEAMAAFPHEV